MPRSLPSALSSAIAAERSACVHLVELTTSGGVQRMTTAPQTISWNAQTWTAVGGHLEIGEAVESPDQDSQGLPLQFSGVDTAILQVLLANNVRGYEIRVWRAHVSESTGAIVADPLEVFRGFQNEAYEIEETRPPGIEPGTCRIRTRVSSRLARLHDPMPVRSNVGSHDSMLARAGQGVGDTFFKNTPAIVNVPIYWGTNAPARSSTGSVGRGDGQPVRRPR